MIALVVVLIFIAVALNTYAILWLPRRESHLTKKRLEELTNLRMAWLQDTDSRSAEGRAERPAEPFFSRLGSLFSVFFKKGGMEFAETRLSLMQAGFYQEHSVRSYLSLRILAALLLLCFGFIFVFLIRDTAPTPLLAMLLVLAPPAGYSLPAFFLRWKIQSRQAEIARALPDALDFLVVCVEAGLGLNAALVRVGKEIGIKSKALGEELMLVNQEMRAGAPREEALRHLSGRNLVEDLNIVVASLILADKLGTSIADTLRAQSDSLRTRVRQRAEETAARAGIKLLFPLVFMVLPTLFIVILGPAVIMGMRALIAMSQR
jgi:tight adherence protein C